LSPAVRPEDVLEVGKLLGCDCEPGECCPFDDSLPVAADGGKVGGGGLVVRSHGQVEDHQLNLTRERSPTEYGSCVHVVLFLECRLVGIKFDARVTGEIADE